MRGPDKRKRKTSVTDHPGGTQNNVVPCPYLVAVTRMHFTNWEWKVMHLVSLGLSNRLIGEIVHNTESTVSTHLQYVFDKAGVFTRRELAAWYDAQRIKAVNLRMGVLA